jgi:hypothetical protein
MFERVTMNVTMQVTPPQALALKAMFEEWNRLSSIGSSRVIAFYADGDGNFHPKCEMNFSEELPELTPDLRTAAVIENDNGNKTFDFDPIAWRINHSEVTGDTNEKNEKPGYLDRVTRQGWEWVSGNVYHNEEDDECCPDFSCCYPQLFEPNKDKRFNFMLAQERRIKAQSK